MPYDHPVPEPFGSSGWKMKIRDRERNEEPHVTIIRKQSFWRFGLRSLVFLDRLPDPRDVPSEITKTIHRDLDLFCQAWDAMYPQNPVQPESDNGC